jgi:hypothetical protein
MATIEEKRRRRSELPRALYEETDGVPRLRAALRGVAWAAQAAGAGVVGAAALRALQPLG